MSDGLPPDDAAALEDALAPLREAFRAKLPGRLAEFEAQAAAAGAGDAEALAELRRLAHTLKGTAGSYGLDAVSRAAARLEERSVGGPSEIDAALAELRGAVAAAEAPPT